MQNNMEEELNTEQDSPAPGAEPEEELTPTQGAEDPTPAQAGEEEGEEEPDFSQEEEETACEPDPAHPYLTLPIQENKIFIASRLGAYNGNPKYIAEEILRQGLPYDLVWMVDKHLLHYIKDFPKGVRLVMRGTDAALKEYATARIRIDDTWREYFLNNKFEKREGQIYIQTWRGSFGMRKVGAERHNAVMREVRRAKKDTDQVDYLISNSAWETDLYRRIFWGKGKVLEFGHARNDLLFRTEDREEIRRRVFERLGVPEDAKLLYYAPTFEKGRSIAKTLANSTITRLALSKRFGGEWYIAARMGKVTKKQWPGTGRNVVKVPKYYDVHELMAAADAVLTDYSCAALDFALSGRPVFLYAPDEKWYTTTRGLYYPLTETPFPVARNNMRLAYLVETFDEEAYKERLQAFLAEKGCVEDGCACRRAVELIRQLAPVQAVNQSTEPFEQENNTSNCGIEDEIKP